MPKNVSSTEAEFLKILATPADEVGHFKLGNLDYPKFSKAITLYLGMARSKDRSRITSKRHQRAAETINGYLLEAQRLPAERHSQFLYQKLADLLHSGIVKKYGWDNEASQLYQLIQGYQSWYYGRVIVAQSTPEHFAQQLEQLDRATLSKSDKKALTALQNTLAPFLKQPSPHHSLAPTQTALHKSLFGSHDTLSNDLGDVLRDRAVRQAYEQANKLLDTNSIKNPELRQKLGNYNNWYELQWSNFSYSEKSLIPKLRTQAEHTMKELTRAINQKNNALSDSQQLAQTRLNQLKNVQQQQKEYTQQLIKFKAENQQLHAIVAKQKIALEQQEVKRWKSEEHNKDLQAQLDAATTSQLTLQEEILALQQALKNYQQQVNAGYESVRDLTQLKQSTALHNHTLMAENSALKQESAKLEKERRQNTDLMNAALRARNQARTHVENLQQQNVILIKENAQLKSMVATLKAFLKSLLGFFGTTLFSESKLKDNIAVEQLQVVDELIDNIGCRVSQLPTRQNPNKFPTKPPLAEALPLLRAITKVDAATRQRLLDTYPGQISNLILKLIGKAVASPADYDAVSAALKIFADQVGQAAIAQLQLSHKLLAQAQETLFKRLLAENSKEAAQARFDRLASFGNDFYRFLAEKNKHRAVPTPISSPLTSTLTFFPAAPVSLDKSADELEAERVPIVGVKA